MVWSGDPIEAVGPNIALERNDIYVSDFGYFAAIFPSAAGDHERHSPALTLWRWSVTTNDPSRTYAYDSPTCVTWTSEH